MAAGEVLRERLGPQTRSDAGELAFSGAFIGHEAAAEPFAGAVEALACQRKQCVGARQPRGRSA